MLYLFPNSMSDNDDLSWVSKKMLHSLSAISALIVENQKAINKFFVKLGLKDKLNSLEIYQIKRLSSSEIGELLNDARRHKFSIGLMSDAGCPGVGDPGSEVVRIAHKVGLQVESFVGPNSMVQALMNSGLNGQNFAFNGYLPVEKNELKTKLKTLESRVKKEGQTQLFIETPYRNQHLFNSIIDNLDPKISLSISLDLMGEQQWSATNEIKVWKKKKPEFQKLPAIFILG